MAELRAEIDGILACVSARTCIKDDDYSQVQIQLTGVLTKLALKGFQGPAPDFPPDLLVESVMRFLRHNDTAVHREDSTAVPSAVRSWPKLGLAWSLLGHMEYFWGHCDSGSSGSSSSSGSIHRPCQSLLGGVAGAGGHLDLNQQQQLQQLSVGSRRALLVETAVASCGVGLMSKKTGKVYHTRGLNELPLRRHTLAAWMLDLALPPPHNNNGNGSGDGFPPYGEDCVSLDACKH